MTRDLHALETRIEHLRNDESLTPENKQAILEFIDECAAEGLSPARQRKYIYVLRAIAVRYTPEEFQLKDANEDELKRLVATINRSSYAEATKVDFKKAIKKYYKILNGRVEPDKTRFIKARMSKPTQVTRADIYTQEELDMVISQLRNVRDKAFFSVMYESAVRPAELLGCSIESVEFREDGDYISVFGIKGTPDRRNLLVRSGTLLREWIRHHPAGGDPQRPRDPSSPLWIKLEQTTCKNCGVPAQRHSRAGCDHYEPKEIERVTYDGMRRAFKRACARAEMKLKKDRMYSLRHTRITEVSQFMSNQQLCRFAGWRPSSGQFEVYVHLTDSDVSSAIREHYGLRTKAEAVQVTCPVCGARNLPGALECRRCMRPLSLEASIKSDSLRDALKIVAELHERGELEGALDRLSLKGQVKDELSSRTDPTGKAASYSR